MTTSIRLGALTLTGFHASQVEHGAIVVEVRGVRGTSVLYLTQAEVDALANVAAVVEAARRLESEWRATAGDFTEMVGRAVDSPFRSVDALTATRDGGK